MTTFFRERMDYGSYASPPTVVWKWVIILPIAFLVVFLGTNQEFVTWLMGRLTP